MLDSRLVGFADALRGHGVVVGTSDIIDAGLAAEALGLDDRARLREGLAAALLRRAGQREVFDDLFDVWFPAAVGARSALGADADLDPVEGAERRSRAAALRAELARALASGDPRELDRVAARAVAELGRVANEASLGGFSAAQTLDALDPRAAIAGAEQLLPRGEGASGQSPGAAGGQQTGAGGFAERFTRDELRSEVAAFRRRVEVESRRRNAEARGRDRISRYAVSAPLEERPFLLSGKTDLEELRRSIDPLARKLATRIAARRRRATRGSIDMRRTLRRSLSTGGIPIRPALQHGRPSRADLVLLCDLSQSVAGFSRFTILLVQALAGQFRRVRVFGFVNVCEELTDLVVAARPGDDLQAALSDTTRMTRWHRNSDYGSTLVDFAEHHLDAVGHRTAVLILGDARTNGTDPRVDALREIVERARHVSWLNPEPARSWSMGDSVAHRYAEVVDMHECRNIAQLRQFVGRLLPV